METTITRAEAIELVNKYARELLDDYYRERTADNFFKVDQVLRVCQKQGLTSEEIPTLIEMQNVIVLG